MFASAGQGIGSLKVVVDQMYGIEIEEFPSLIAQTALWLTDHQMNMEYSRESGKMFKRLPLTHSATIVNDNALTRDWASVIAPSDLNYILGNPPFVGSKMMTAEMRNQLLVHFLGVNSAGVLDFVTAWYAKAAEMMKQNPHIQTALVSTNSVIQGEQVPILWKYLFGKGVHINFLHQTFKWSNDAKGNAAVHCTIIGFALFNKLEKRIFEYANIKDEPIELSARNINGYGVDGPSVLIESRSKPICDVPPMVSGNKPIDNGNYLFTPEEKALFVQDEPKSEPYFKRWLGGVEFINNIERWCLYVKDISPEVLRTMPLVLERIEAVRAYRAASSSMPTRKIADFPRNFHTTFKSSGKYIAMPQVSSERRKYIPIAFLDESYLCGDKLRLIDDATIYHFGILVSEMHMAWMRTVTGRLKSDYQYSKNIVYNNFIWPEVNDTQKVNIEKLAQAILDARADFPSASLADLYDPLTMPPALAKAHKALDKAVDKLYVAKPFTTDTERVAMLFEKYQSIQSNVK